MGRVKKKEYENLSASNIDKVIALLNPPEGKKPISKKEACSILNISYNVTRLQKIIDEHLERKAAISARRAQNRGKPATPDEIRQTIEEYLEGTPVSEIAKRLYRSAGFVKAIVERVGIPQRPTSAEGKYGVELLPEGCISETFAEGEIVWSAKYHSPAIVKKEMPGIYENKYGSKCYRIVVLEEVNSEESFFPYVEHGGFYAYQLAYDLGKISHLSEYGVNFKRL